MSGRGRTAERARGVLSLLKVRTLMRLRGQVGVNRLVAQGLELGRGVYVAPTA